MLYLFAKQTRLKAAKVRFLYFPQPTKTKGVQQSKRLPLIQSDTSTGNGALSHPDY